MGILKMKNKRIYLKIQVICFLIVMLVSPFLLAQKPNYKFKTIKQSDGLINSTVQAIFEDSFGFIWLGTHHGVQRYEGKSFKNYIHTNTDSSGLSSNYINGFCEDSEKNIWITTSNGLNKYIRETDKIEKYVWQNKSFAKNDEPFIFGIIKDITENNNLWLTALGVGLIKLDIKNDSVTIYPLQAVINGWLSWIIPYPGKKDQLLLGRTGLVSFDKISGKFNEILALEQNAEIPNHLINDAKIDPLNENVIWLATGDIWGRGNQGGLIRFNLITGQKTLFSPETRKDDMPDKHLLKLCFYDSENLWIGTRKHGALLYKTSEDRFYNFKKNEYDEGSFTTVNTVRSMLLDRSGTLWFGTWGDGISLLSPATQKFTHYKHLPGKENDFQNNFITSFAEDKQGNIWIGTKKGGLSKFNPRDKTFENYFQEFAIPGQNPTEITYLFFDSKENLWVGTYDDALYRFTPATGTKIHYKKGSSKSNVTQKRISAITEFNPGEVFISTYGGGLNIYDYQTEYFRHFIHHPNDSTSIPDNQIWLPFTGNDGNYYFSGNSSAGLIQFNPKTETFIEIYLENLNTTFMMPTKTSDGSVFINDVAEGLREIIIQDEITINTVYDVDGNIIKNIETILVDAENKLWMGTGNGLLEFDPINKIVKRYDTDDGLQGNEFNRFAAFKSSGGEMYFGGKNGFNVFHPDKIKMSNYKPHIVFTDFSLFQESVAIGKESPLKQNILLMDKIDLEYDQNDFSISFAALDFSNPDKIKYKYILENHDEDWIKGGYNNVASYTNMDPGEYTFNVLATNGDGVWNSKEKSIQIFISPPWWFTKWAYGFYLLLVAVGVFGIDRFMRNRLVQKERERSRALELEQAKEIEKAYNKLKTTQTQLLHSEKMASLGELTAGIAHEIQNPLNFVNNFSDVSVDLVEELNEELSEGNTEEMKSISQDLKQNLEKIHHHGERASSIVRGMLEHSRAGTDEKQPTDINAMADEYIRLAYHGIRAKDKSFNADFKTDLDENLPKISVVGQDIARVVLNLINNAFHAVSAKASANVDPNYKPFVSISTKKINGQVEIRVKDNGMGIPENILDKIFQPFFTTKPSGEGTGLGLSLSYDIIIKGHGGELRVETKEGKGSCFIINLPLQ